MARGPSEAKLVWDEAHDLKHIDSALHWPRLLRSMINKQVAPPAFLPVNGSLVNINLTDMRLAINLTRGLKGGSACSLPFLPFFLLCPRRCRIQPEDLLRSALKLRRGLGGKHQTTRMMLAFNMALLGA